MIKREQTEKKAQNFDYWCSCVDSFLETLYLHYIHKKYGTYAYVHNNYSKPNLTGYEVLCRFTFIRHTSGKTENVYFKEIMMFLANSGVFTILWRF